MIMNFTPGFFEEYVGQPFVIGTTDGDFLYGIKFFWDSSDAHFEADSLNKTYDLPTEGSYQVIELHQEYEIDVLYYEHRGEGGEFLAGWSCEGTKVGVGLDIEMGENSTLTITHGRMLKRDFEDMEEFEGY